MSNFTDAKAIKKGNLQESSMVNYKLRITLLFRTNVSSQFAKAKRFRNKEYNEDYSIIGDSLSEEISGGNIFFSDNDESNSSLIIKDRVFIASEDSPKGMEIMSKAIDSYIRGICYISDVKKVIPCFFIPSISDSSVVPTLFFHSFPPKSLAEDSEVIKSGKLDVTKGLIYFFGFDKIVSLVQTALNIHSYNNSAFSKELIQLFALLCHYTYFYIDMLEQKEWSLFKSNISDKKSIEAFFTEKPSQNIDNSLWKKIGNNIAKGLALPFKAINWTFEKLFNYDGHLQGRIYHRIKEVVDVTNEVVNNKKNVSDAIFSILSDKETMKRPYLYFEKCGYWNYYDNPNLKCFCEKWEVESSKKGIISGYGAVRFKNSYNNDIIYCLKGTDFDSYGRDWILTNLLQGLTGFSLQHARAVVDARLLDAEIGNKGNLWFIGHSLGGGLASTATIATRQRTGVTFNAAGLNVIGVKVTQLFNNPSHIFHPSKSWKRVFPYRIKGEVLDTAQKIPLRILTLGTLERGYGRQSVEMDVDEKVASCGDKHGINNFLRKNVMEKLAPFEQAEGDKNLSSTNNKIIKIEFYSKNTNLTANTACIF